MPATWPGLELDDRGECSWCRCHRSDPPLGEAALLAILRRARGPEYDCVVGVSGGKDSCYVALVASRRLGARVLAVFYDHSFMSDLARRNAATVCARLGIELVVVRSGIGVERQHLRDRLPAAATTGITHGLCDVCRRSIDTALRATATARGIPFILTGETQHETWELGAPVRRIIERLGALSAGALVRLARAEVDGALRARRAAAEIGRLAAAIPGSRTVEAGRGGPPFQVPFYRYVPWDHDLIERTLSDELGWQPPPQALSWRYDCALEPVLDLMMLRRFGISTAGLYLSNLVRDGVFSRERALGLLAEMENEARLARHAAELVSSLGLSPATLRALTGAR